MRHGLLCTTSSARAVTLCCHRAAQDEPASAPSLQQGGTHRREAIAILATRTALARLPNWVFDADCFSAAVPTAPSEFGTPRAAPTRALDGVAATVPHSSLTVNVQSFRSAALV